MYVKFATVMFIVKIVEITSKFKILSFTLEHKNNALKPLILLTYSGLTMLFLDISYI